MSQLDLEELRKCIDALDEKLQNCLIERIKLAEEVAKAKHAQESKPSFYRPEREAEVLRNALKRNQGSPVPDVFLTHFFRDIMSLSLSLQQPLKVAYLGPEGTYTQAAVIQHFGSSVEAVPVAEIEEVFREVEAGNVDYGMVPVENSTEGGVNQSLDMFIQSSLKICGEVELGIHHNLLSNAASLDQIQRVYAHQQALRQCRLWLDNRLPHVGRIALNSNAEAARRAAQEEGSAAIAGRTAADLYQLGIVCERIEDEPSNTTRFAVLGKRAVAPTGQDKTSLLLATPNKPGALYQLLTPLAQNQISMSRIESRPSRKTMWDYVFFIDIDGHIKDENVAAAVQIIREQSVMFKNLGSYPKAIA